MSDSTSTQLSAIESFRSLHASGCFVLPNPWDIGTSRYLQHLGFKALATTSAGFAFSRGLPDDVWIVGRDAMLAHIREIVNATPLPVNADFQNGYADEPAQLSENVALCVATGVAGLSIEDATGNNASPLYERDLAVERIRSARQAIDNSGLRVVLTARCEAWLVGTKDPFAVAIDRLTAFADAGADCLFAPGVQDPNHIRAIVNAVSPNPVNVLVWTPGLTVTQLADLGVRRISVGSALARTAFGAFAVAAKSIATTGSFEAFGNAAAFAELNAIFR